LSVDSEWEGVPHPGGQVVKRVEVIKSVLKVDGIISIPKFKTHAFMIFTGATKNMFGVIPGLTKVGYHGKFPQKDRFAGMLIDVASLVKPRLSIMDAILAMEGKGPGTGGTPRPLGLLMAGTDTVAMDVVCCRIAGFDPAAIPVLSVARDRGLWGGRAVDLPTFGVPVDDLVLKDFQPPSKGVASDGLDAPVIGAIGRAFLRSGFSPRPRPQIGPCTICGSCEQACPGQAITMDKKDHVAKVNDDKCIRCYCCHEVCPNAAIELNFTGMGRVMHGFRLV
jgi:ferredoxin